MSSVEFEAAFIVLLKSKRRALKSILVMTITTVWRYSFLRELPFVIIGVTIHTPGMFEWGSQANFVAQFAIYIHMFSFKPEVCFIVIELANAFHRLKRFFGMTLCTLLSKLVIVNIFMAVYATVKRNAVKPLKFFPVQRAEIGRASCRVRV